MQINSFEGEIIKEGETFWIMSKDCLAIQELTLTNEMIYRHDSLDLKLHWLYFSRKETARLIIILVNEYLPSWNKNISIIHDLFNSLSEQFKIKE